MTAAIRSTAWVQPDTLADMQDRHARYLRMADAFHRDGDDAHARLYEDEAVAEAERIALREDAERRFAASRVPVHVFGEEIPAQTEGTGAAAYTFGAVLIVAGITMGIPAVCWLWQTLGRALS